ncbi:NUDIX hydrolase [Pelagicoccus sp. SDUM812002]|uniref:NUDIX hydrolase n=1 Tax=Pelagicoccus sp. SDUM812002 TaxID=3041266 RepID=UPI00280E116E|nr:NUDIX hydrolase [Pelagicoccus sp. SDUM812002]MDQ8185748.1 NUDIX hydrolase [Pelagicoccus sp. SDUM812002]
MKRQPLIALLETYRSLWADESEACDRYLEFVSRNPDCFERSLREGHVTGSAWIVNTAGTHVLLTHHRKLGQWFQLGGHADGESDVAKVAMLEAREESGLAGLQFVSDEIFDIDIHLIPARKSDPEHYHYDVRFALQSMVSDAYTVSEESLNLAWVELANLTEYTTEESMLRMARKWRELQWG